MQWQTKNARRTPLSAVLIRSINMMLVSAALSHFESQVLCSLSFKFYAGYLKFGPVLLPRPTTFDQTVGLVMHTLRALKPRMPHVKV